VEDAAAMIRYLNEVGGESDNLLFGKDEFYLTVEKEAQYIEGINSNPDSLMLLGLIGSKIVSVSLISSLGRKRIAHNSDLSISVKKDYWGLGIGNAVIAELLNFAREHRSIINVSLGVRADNKAAIHLYEKFGFKRIGVHQDYFNVSGTYYDELLMDLYL
jgi:ribosomal protein S18 acetylase RimI-like enzyme